jgi:hypothetical protein
VGAGGGVPIRADAGACAGEVVDDGASAVGTIVTGGDTGAGGRRRGC